MNTCSDHIHSRSRRETLPSKARPQRQDPPWAITIPATRSYSQQKKRKRHAPSSGASRSTNIQKARPDLPIPAEVTAICSSAWPGERSGLCGHVLVFLISFISFIGEEHKVQVFILEPNVVINGLFVCLFSSQNQVWLS